MRNKEFWKGYLVTQVQTTIHKFWVFYFLAKIAKKIVQEDLPFLPAKSKEFRLRFAGQLLWRGLKHDLTKYKMIEAEGFAKNSFKLRTAVYGTPDYQVLLDDLENSLKHHYANNSHHPQYHSNGVADMSTLDKIEMSADWTAACKRTKDGDVRRSIEINQKRFNFDDADKELISSIVDLIERRRERRIDVENNF